LKLAIHLRGICYQTFVWESKSSARGVKGEGLTLDVERGVGPPYSDCQRHSNLISVPNRNSNGINEYLDPENYYYVEL
jgi:hypothetical protein